MAIRVRSILGSLFYPGLECGAAAAGEKNGKLITHVINHSIEQKTTLGYEPRRGGRDENEKGPTTEESSRTGPFFLS